MLAGLIDLKQIQYNKNNRRRDVFVEVSLHLLQTTKKTKLHTTTPAFSVHFTLLRHLSHNVDFSSAARNSCNAVVIPFVFVTLTIHIRNTYIQFFAGHPPDGHHRRLIYDLINSIRTYHWATKHYKEIYENTRSVPPLTIIYIHNS